jgi:hypothetical protein
MPTEYPNHPELGDGAPDGTEQRPTVQIQRVDESDVAALHLHYPRQTSPQPVRLCLDLRTGELYCEANAAIGSGTPIDIWHGIVRTWTIPALRPAAANALMDDVATPAQQILDGSRVVWDGRNHCGQLDEAASVAEEEIREACEQVDLQDVVQVWAAADWYAGLGGRDAQRAELGITQQSTDEELQAIVDGEDVDMLDDGLEYLQGLRDTIWTDHVAEVAEAMESAPEGEEIDALIETLDPHLCHTRDGDLHAALPDEWVIGDGAGGGGEGYEIVGWDARRYVYVEWTPGGFTPHDCWVVVRERAPEAAMSAPTRR